ncbi:MAG: hypothetical protein Q7S11_04475, partial [bacterium]|nr:hypothetical protein [bacterium]
PTPIKHIFLNGNMLATVQGGWGNGILYYDHTDHLTGSNIVSDSGAHVAELTDYLPYGSIRTDDRING